MLKNSTRLIDYDFYDYGQLECFYDWNQIIMG